MPMSRWPPCSIILAKPEIPNTGEDRPEFKPRRAT
jgi:hypothetical protein